MTTAEKEFESGCLSRVGDDEPVFVVRAADKSGPAIVQAWSIIAELIGTNKHKVEEARRISREMLQWQIENGYKIPD